LLSEQSNKGSSFSWREADRFSTQNGKDQPIPREARARQELVREKVERNKKVDVFCVCRLIRQKAIGHTPYIYIYGSTWPSADIQNMSWIHVRALLLYRNKIEYPY